jgi:hypothetical protein
VRHSNHLAERPSQRDLSSYKIRSLSPTQKKLMDYSEKLGLSPTTMFIYIRVPIESFKGKYVAYLVYLSVDADASNHPRVKNVQIRRPQRDSSTILNQHHFDHHILFIFLINLFFCMTFVWNNPRRLNSLFIAIKLHLSVLLQLQN